MLFGVGGVILIGCLFYGVMNGIHNNLLPGIYFMANMLKPFQSNCQYCLIMHYVHWPLSQMCSLSDVPVSHKQPQVGLTRHTYSTYVSFFDGLFSVLLC